jgi:hypothetical protein
LEITFQTAELREICEKRDVATLELGYAAARELADRLADIEAVDTVAELSQLLGELICEESLTERFVRLESGFRIFFVSAHREPVGSASQSTDWEKTSRVRIIAIEQING